MLYVYILFLGISEELFKSDINFFLLCLNYRFLDPPTLSVGQSVRQFVIPCVRLIIFWMIVKDNAMYHLSQGRIV